MPNAGSPPAAGTVSVLAFRLRCCWLPELRLWQPESIRCSDPCCEGKDTREAKAGQIVMICHQAGGLDWIETPAQKKQFQLLSEECSRVPCPRLLLSCRW